MRRAENIATAACVRLRAHAGSRRARRWDSGATESEAVRIETKLFENLGNLEQRRFTYAVRGTKIALKTECEGDTSLEGVRDRAERALAVHPLRVADAMQLAAALLLARDRPRRRAFVVTHEEERE